MSNPFDQFDAATPQGDSNPFDQFDAGKKKDSRSAVGEIANQFKAGILVDLPKMAGQALKYTSDPGNKVYEAGQGITDWADEQGKRPDLAPQEDQHNIVTNALASGARMIPQSVAPAAAVGAGILALPASIPATVGLGAASVLGAVPAAMSQGQETLEKAREKGIPEDQALAAARSNALIEGGGEALGTYAGGKLLGIAGKTAGKMFGRTASDALADQTSTAVTKPFLKQLGETALVETGTEIGQNAGEAAVENSYGIDSKTPYQAGKEAIAPTLGMTALLAPFGLAGFAHAGKQRGERTNALASAETTPEERQKIAGAFADEIGKVDEQAAANFMANAQAAIDTKQSLTIGESMFSPPVAAAKTPAPLALPSPTYTGTPSDQVLQADAERQNAVDEAQKSADALYAERADFEQSQAPAAGYVAPVIPVVGPLSAIANLAVQSGAHAQTQMQAAMQEAVAKQKNSKGGAAGTPAGAQKVATAPAQGPLAEVASAAAPSVAPAAPSIPAQAPNTGAENSDSITEHARAWDRANRNSRSDEWFAGYAESNPAFNAVGEAGDRIPAHGMAKVATLGEGVKNLISLLTGGIDPNRTFYYDSLTANTGNRGSGTGTAGGHAYRNGPFIITFREGLQGQPTAADITGVLVNPAHSELVAPLQQMFPNLAIRDYNGVSDVVAASRSQRQANAPQAGAQPVAAPAASQSPAIDLSQRTDGQLAYLSQHGKNGRQEAAIAEIQRRGVQVSAAQQSKTDAIALSGNVNSDKPATNSSHVPALNSANSANGQQEEAGIPASTAGGSRSAPAASAKTEDSIGWTRMTTVQREALVAKAGWTGKIRGMNLGGVRIARQAWGDMTEANRAKLIAASQNPIKNEAPSAATVPAESVAPKQAPIKKDEQPKNASDRLRSGEINVEQFMEATGLTDDDVGTFSSNGARNKADAQAKKESRYHAGIEKISAAIFEAERGLTQGSTAQSRRAYQANVAKYRQAQETLGVIAKRYEHPFKNTLLSKLPPFLESRFGKQWDGIEHGDSAKRAFHGDSYRKWVDLLIGAADNKNGTPISPAVSQPKADTAPEAKQDKAPVSTEQSSAVANAQATTPSIQRLQDQLDKTDPFSEESQSLTHALQSAVTDDARSAIDAGEMPVYKVTDHVSVAIHPSAQNPGMVQVTRYTKDGVIGDSQYNNIDEAVRYEGLTHKPRIAPDEAVAAIEKSIQAEAEYQARKAAPANQVPVKNEAPAAATVPAETVAPKQEPIKNEDDWLGALFGAAPTAAESASKEVQTNRQAQDKADRVDSAIAMLTGEIEASNAAAAEVAARNYKSNRKQIELKGDGPGKNGSLSISAINESRKRRTVEALQNASSSIKQAIEFIAENPDAAFKQVADMEAAVTKQFNEGFFGPSAKLDGQLDMAVGSLIGSGSYSGEGSAGRKLRMAAHAYASVDAVSQPKTDAAPEAKQGKAPAPKPKPARNNIDAENDSLFVAIAKAGGMDTDELLSNGIDSNDITYETSAKVKKDGQLGKKRRMPISFGFALPLHKKGGMSFDGMREAMQQYGYLPQDATKNDAIDLFKQELAGDPVYTAQAIEFRRDQDQEEFDKQMAKEQDRIDAELAAQEIAEDDAGFNELSLDEQSLASDFAEFAFGENGKQDDNATRAGMRALGFTEEEINDELAKNSRAQRESEEIAAGSGQESGAGRNGNRAEDAQAPERDGEEGFGLAGQTNTQAAAEFKRQKEEAAKKDDEPSAPSVKADQVDLFATQGGLFNSNRDDAGRSQEAGKQAEPVAAPKKGDRFKDGAGKTWEIWNARSSLIEAFPVIDDKIRVNNQDGQRFATDARARSANPEARTDYFPTQKAKQPVTPQLLVGDPEKYIKVAADSIKTLRKVDVYRVLIESNRAEFRLALAGYIKEQRPDLADEVDSVLAEAKAAEQSPAVDANGDLRGYAYALVKNGQILISGSFPSPKYMEADESSSVTKWQKEADRLGADLYIGGYPGADTFEPQDGLIFGMTFDEIAAKQNKRTIPASINRKMPKDAVLAYEAQAKPDAVDAKKQEEAKPVAGPTQADEKPADSKATADAGEELTYNKRNRRTGGLKWEDIKDKNAALRVKEVVKAKVYPKPDYQSLVDGGMRDVVAHIVKQAYDAIAPAPKMKRGAEVSDDALQSYISGVNRVMDGVMKWANDGTAVSKWAKAQSKLSGGSFSISELATAETLLDTVYPGGWKTYREEIIMLGGNKILGALQPGHDEVGRALKDIKLGWPAKSEAWQKQGYKVVNAETIDVELYAKPERGDSAAYVSAMVTANNQRIDSFVVRGTADKESPEVQDAIAEKRKQLEGNYVLVDKSGRIEGIYPAEDAAIEAAREKVKHESGEKIGEKGVSVAMAERLGVEHRLPGDDVSSERLKETFGFRGVNFGNWMQGETKAKVNERQLHLNHLFDAFMDLAQLLNVPPKAMSLNGMLGIAVGAQGSGKALAHFVPGVNEINVTRTKGAGALAHEWGHALDHYFATMGGLDRNKEPYLSAHVGTVSSKIENGKLVRSPIGLLDVRPEVATQFQSIVDAMTKRKETEAEYEARIRSEKAIAGRMVAEEIKEIAESIDKAKSGWGTQAVAEKIRGLAERMAALDYGDGRVSMGGTEVPAVVAEIADAYEKASGMPMKNIGMLGYYADRYRVISGILESEEGRTPREVTTDYKKSSDAADAKKKPYWSTKLEMFARAFDAYVVDSLAEKAASNTYLSGIEALAPQGDDRKAIGKAFDFLFAELKTKETDKGTALYNVASNDKLTPTDKAIYGMATEGKSAAEILKFIASASRSPLNRQLANLLQKTGITPSVKVDSSAGWKMNAGNDKKYAAAYNPKTDTVALFRPASAERHVLHELMHASTLKALSKKGMAAGQMKALFAHVKKSGELKGMYGMSDVDEFVAEAFSNPKFQEALKKIAAPSVSSSIKSGWHWFVRIVRGILGMPQEQENALSQAIEIGLGVMRENMRLNEGTADVRYNAAPGKISQTDTAAFSKWFGDSKVVDADGKPLVVYHGTGATDISDFKVSKRGTYGGGIYLTPDIRGANDYAIYRGAPSSTVYPVYAAIKNPASGAEASQVASWKGEENAREELIRRGYDGVVDMRSGEIVAFYPSQVKSAIGNNGDFDGSNPDIRYNVADEGWNVSEQAKEVVMRLAGRPMLDPADPFAAENARLREQDKSLWSKAKKQMRRYLAPGGLLPQSVFAEKIKRDSEFQAVEFDVRHLIGGLEQAVKADFGIAFDKLSKEQMRPITEALAGNVPASLPEATKTAAVAMRQYIDGMSTEYLKIIQQKIDAKMLKAMESGKESDKAQAINEIELFEKIKGNIGRYVHRSYQAFDDPKWFEKVPAPVLNASRLYLKQGYMEAGETDAKAAQLAEVTLHEILKNGTAYDSMESFIAESKLGAKDLSVLMRRKEVPAQIRALLGEYPDARLNFTKSATKMGRLIWNTRFLDRVRDIGMGSFFFEGKDRPANATTQIAAGGSEAYAPLNGLWTFPEIAQSFKDALGKEQMSDLYRAIVRANGLVKYGKTVLAPTTAMRNWQSAMFFSLANGHFDLTQMKKSISAFREQVSQKATGQDLKYLRHLKQLGVVYDTPYAGEMARLMEDARMDELLSSDKGDAVRWFRKANQLAQGFYTFGDDFWKIIGFENEKSGLMKAGLSLQESEIEAAKRIRDTYPTYSMVGRGVQWLSRFPLAGTFVSFPAEIIRTSSNMLRTVANDLKSDNPKLRELGMKRAAGMAFVSAAFYGLAALSMAMAGVGDDEDEAIRDLAPEWQKNSTFLYLGRDEKGSLRYFDMSFLDPYGYWKRPITAMLRNQPWEDSLASGLRGMLEPFLGADISAAAIFEAVSNQKESGGKVYKEKDGAIDQAVDIADHLRKALQPGVVGNVERLVKAAGDVRKSSGQPYSMEDELVALAGWRATTIEPKTALYYRSFEFTDSLSEARKTLTDTLRDANSVSPEDIKDAKARAASKQEQAFKEMGRLVGAAEAAGMSKMQIIQTLRLSNISQANIASLMRGATPDVSIAPQLAARAVRQASQMRGPEYAAEVFDRYRQAMAN